MIHNSARRWAGMGLGALILAGGTFALCSRTLAQGQTKREIRQVPQDQAQQDPAQFGGGQPGQPGQGFQGQGQFGPGGPGGGFPGGPGGPGGPGMMMMGGGGGGGIAATSTTVYVLRGNQLMAFDASTLKLKAQAEMPMPRGMAPGNPGPGGFGGPGGGAPGGFGGGGGGNNFGGGRPEREQR